jgi:hypothetical protein
MRTAPAERFLVRRWPEGQVVFDRRFGDTHAMDSVTGLVFNALLADPGQHAVALAGLLTELPAMERLSRANSALTQLQQLGLV